MNWVSAPVVPPSQTTTSRLIASKHCSNLGWSWPPSEAPHSLNYHLAVHLYVYSIKASKCISKLTQSHSWGTSANSHYYGLQVRTIMAFLVHPKTRSITASECNSELARLQPPSVSPKLHDYGLQVRTITACKFARLHCTSASPNMFDHGLGEHLWVHLIMVWWNAVARRQTAHRKYSAAPHMASEGNLLQGLVLALGA